MDLLIILLYSLLCWTVFKVFKVPVNKWSLTTAFLGGLAIISTTLLLMNYNHPYTSNARTFFISTPIITNVTSTVIDVKVDLQQEVKEGDTLFVLDSTAFYSNVIELEASKKIYEAQIKAHDAEYKLAQKRYNQSKQLAKAEAGSQYDVELYESEAAQAKALIQTLKEQIKQADAQLIKARWNLSQCYVLAPYDGLVAQNRLKKGMRAVQFPLRPLMSFVSTDSFYVVAAMPQNPRQRIVEGDKAEVIFDAVPGVIFHGKVNLIGEVIAQGELQANGLLYNFDLPHIQGSLPYIIEITDDMSAYKIPGGAKAKVAIYSQHIKPVAMIRMVLLRMKGWQNYLFGEH